MADPHWLPLPEVYTINPAVWSDDPECGHKVACEFQTHYCTYIRAPRLLTLQQVESSNELLLLTLFQWFELWHKVIKADLEGTIADRGNTFETVKLLRRGVELFRLFGTALFNVEKYALELNLRKTLRSAQGVAFSLQLFEIAQLAHQVNSMTRSSQSQVDEAVREFTAALESFVARVDKFAQTALVVSPRAQQTYAEWLRLPDLLNLQQGVKANWAEPGECPAAQLQPDIVGSDENMFIVVHQCFEIWFKVILEHIDRSISLVAKDQIADATRLLRRVVEIERLLVQQIQIPTTMLPLDFARFRYESVEHAGRVLVRGLSPASGTESYQFREIEIVAGLRDDSTFQKFLGGTEKLPTRFLTPRQTERLALPTLPEVFRQALKRRRIVELQDLFTPAAAANPNADLAEMADTLIDFDDSFQQWRLGHVSMVKKMIGAKSGTGFLGPEYLMETAGLQTQQANRIFAEPQVRPRFFEDLWSIRSRLGAH